MSKSHGPLEYASEECPISTRNGDISHTHDVLDFCPRLRGTPTKAPRDLPRPAHSGATDGVKRAEEPKTFTFGSKMTVFASIGGHLGGGERCRVRGHDRCLLLCPPRELGSIFNAFCPPQGPLRRPAGPKMAESYVLRTYYVRSGCIGTALGTGVWSTTSTRPRCLRRPARSSAR